jgi:hypothetical protein
MDFLDPEKKRANSIKLFIGHTLMGVLVLVGTYILVFQAYGFDIDRKTGEVIQNGLVFVDSAPDAAEIKLNGEVNREQTNTRLSLPEGSYELEINKQGYRTWKKSFDLKGGSIERFNYPTLFLNDLSPESLQTFENTVGFFSQSLDRRWVVVGEQNELTSLIVYDLNTLENERPVSQQIALPDDLLTASTGNHVLKTIEWSSDNKNVLVQHNWPGGQEFVIVNRDIPAASFNVNKTLNSSPTQVNMVDKKIDELYLYASQAKTLNRANVSDLEIDLVANNVLDYKPHGDNMVLIAQAIPSNSKKSQAVLIDSGQSYVIREINAVSGMDLSIAKYDNDWYAAIHDPADNKTYIHINPVDFVKREPSAKQAPIAVLRSSGQIEKLEFSNNAQFIAVLGGQSFSVFDAEYQRTFRFDVPLVFDKGSEVTWMDGHRFTAVSKGNSIVFEFDGQNLQTLVPTQPGLPIAFNRDYTQMYSIFTSSKKPTLAKTELRLEQDR